jgi:hypothetical protein
MIKSGNFTWVSPLQIRYPFAITYGFVFALLCFVARLANHGWEGFGRTLATSGSIGFAVAVVAAWVIWPLRTRRINASAPSWRSWELSLCLVALAYVLSDGFISSDAMYASILDAIPDPRVFFAGPPIVQLVFWSTAALLAGWAIWPFQLRNRSKRTAGFGIMAEGLILSFLCLSVASNFWRNPSIHYRFFVPGFLEFPRFSLEYWLMLWGLRMMGLVFCAIAGREFLFAVARVFLKKAPERQR